MHTSSRLLLSSAFALLAWGSQAQAGALSSDSGRITNGGTGFIGVTQSAGMGREAYTARATAGATSAIPVQAGEASTMVDGRPNQVTAGRDAMAAQAQRSSDARVMGSGAAQGMGMGMGRRNAQPGWGTPD